MITFKRSAAAILITLALSGCATRYVTTPCLTKEQLAELKAAEPPKVADKLTGSAEQDVKTVAGSAVRLRAWGSGMLGILGGCVGE